MTTKTDTEKDYDVLGVDTIHAFEGTCEVEDRYPKLKTLQTLYYRISFELTECRSWTKYGGGSLLTSSKVIPKQLGRAFDSFKRNAENGKEAWVKELRREVEIAFSWLFNHLHECTPARGKRRWEMHNKLYAMTNQSICEAFMKVQGDDKINFDRWEDKPYERVGNFWDLFLTIFLGISTTVLIIATIVKLIIHGFTWNTAISAVFIAAGIWMLSFCFQGLKTGRDFEDFDIFKWFKRGK